MFEVDSEFYTWGWPYTSLPILEWQQSVTTKCWNVQILFPNRRWFNYTYVMYPYSKLSIGYQDIWITFQSGISFSQAREWLSFLIQRDTFRGVSRDLEPDQIPFRKGWFPWNDEFGVPEFCEACPVDIRLKWIRKKIHPPRRPSLGSQDVEREGCEIDTKQASNKGWNRGSLYHQPKQCTKNQGNPSKTCRSF